MTATKKTTAAKQSKPRQTTKPAAKKPAAKKVSATSAKKAAKPQVDPAVSDHAESDCVAIRATVDGVMSGASGGRIGPATPNNALLSLYIIPDKIQFLHILLNEALGSRPGFTPFSSTEIKATASVGDVRVGANKHCNVECPA